MFYVIIFSICAVLLVVGGVTMQSRNRKRFADEESRSQAGRTAGQRQRKAQRAQSRNARRKRD